MPTTSRCLQQQVRTLVFAVKSKDTPHYEVIWARIRTANIRVHGADREIRIRSCGASTITNDRGDKPEGSNEGFFRRPRRVDQGS